MNWYEKIMFKGWQFWRNFKWNKSIKDNIYSISHAQLWNMDDWSLPPKDITNEIELDLNREIILTNTFLHFNLNYNHIIQIDYVYNNINFIILYENSIIIFPPYSQTPDFRFFERDFMDIEISFIGDEQKLSNFSHNFNFLEIDNDLFKNTLFRLRGPGELYYKDLSFVASWSSIILWIKRLYIHLIDEIYLTEKDLEIEIFWTNGEKELF